MGFLHEFGAQDQKFCQEQQAELDVIDLFARHRDDLLAHISRATNLQDLISLSEQVDSLMSEAERQAGSFRFFAQRLWALLPMAQARFSEKFQMTRDRLQAERAGQAESLRRQAQAEDLNREHEARLRQTQEETQAIYRQTAQSNREASERGHQMWMRGQFPDQFCPCCGGHKLLGHTYCHPCYQRRLDGNYSY